MCEKAFTWRRAAKLLLQIELYKVLLLPVVFLLGATPGEVLRALIGVVFWVPMNVNNGFSSSYFVFMLLIPFLNLLLGSMGRRRHGLLVALLLLVETVAFTFFKNGSAFTEVAWYATLYLMAAYVRRYPSRLTEDRGVTSRAFAACIVLSMASVLAVDAAALVLGRSAWGSSYYFVADSGKVMALLTGLTCFLFFKNLEMRPSAAVNSVAATTFGVLLIHANSDAMRELLWGRILDVPSAYSLPLPLLALHALLGAIAVFAVCSAVDRLRIRFVEPVYMGWVDGHSAGIEALGRRLLLVPGRVARLLEKSLGVAPRLR